MNKSYKMVLLRSLLTRFEGEWFLPVQALDAAKSFHHYLNDRSYRKNIDISDKQGKDLEVYNERTVASLIQRMPMTMWGSSAKMIDYEDKVFKINFDIAPADRAIVYEWIRQICEYRLKGCVGYKPSAGLPERQETSLNFARLFQSLGYGAAV